MGALFSPSIHRYIFLLSLGVAFCSLPFSRFTVSVGMIALGINWILEGGWKAKIQRVSTNISLYLFFLIYVMFIIGMFYTSDLGSGLTELKQKLPMVLIPLVLSSSKPLNTKEFFYILLFFCLAVTISTFYSYYLFFNNFINGGSNVRGISPFISHIRMGLMVNLAFFISLYYGIKPPGFIQVRIRIVLFLIAAWLVLFLFVLQSLTGIVVFFTTSLILGLLLFLKLKKPRFKIIIVLFLSIASLTILTYLYVKVNSFFSREEIEIESMPSHTINGSKYFHLTDDEQYENGHRVWLFICWSELEQQWDQMSSLSYQGKDMMGQPLRLTLIRYLTSKGLTKDSAGLAQLDDVDIQLIESGATSVIFREHRFGLYPRLYQLLWEIDQYKSSKKISGSPLIQRMVYIRAAIRIIYDNFWLGVGTGDLRKSFNDYYKESEPNLKPSFWFLSHNQFLTQWVSLGVFGFLIFIAGWFVPFIKEQKYKELLPLAFMLIVTFSMLNEDTLETHIGVSLASLFYGLFIFGTPKKGKVSPDNED